jgi:glucose-1-phosphate cytidylyltransferase
MKVVLFCGGLGIRLRDYSEDIPKPLVPLGGRPILWHLMRYYAHYGHKDFTVCLGYKGDLIRRYFDDGTDSSADDDALDGSGSWRITFVDTGLSSSIGQRLGAVQPFLDGETIFLANYADGLTDFPLPRLIEAFKARQAVGMFLSVRPNVSWHFVRHAPDGRVLSVDDAVTAGAWINGGYFVFSSEIFSYLRPGEDLVEQPFQRLIDEGKLFACDYQGFWRCIDTYKDLQTLEGLLNGGAGPWKVW